MFELNKTIARRDFKSLLGQANHFLITILIGLDGVHSGKVEKSEEFSTSWNPNNVKRSAERSREFVLDLALVRAVDALDTYIVNSARKPFAISDNEFIKRMDGTGRSVARRLEIFDDNLVSLPAYVFEALKVAIEWRNKRVHSTAKVRIDKRTNATLIAHEDNFRAEYSGLNISSFLKSAASGQAPTFKEAASIIRLVHDAVLHYDNHLLTQMEIERYLKDALFQLLREQPDGGTKAVAKSWAGEKKDTKVTRLLRMVGVNETDKVKGRLVPMEFVSKLISLEVDQVESFLSSG